MYDKEKAGTFLGLAGTMQSVGILAGGPVIGFIVDMAGWRTPHYLLGPLFLLAAFFMYSGVKVTKSEVSHMASASASFDFPGALSIVAFLTGVILALSLGQFAPFGSTLNNALWVIAAIALITLIAVIVKKKDKAIIPSTVLSDRNTLCLVSFNFLANFSIMALYFFLPLYATHVMQQSSAAAGLTLTCMSVAGLFMGPIFGKMIGKSGNARNVILSTITLRIVIFIAFIVFLKPTTSILLVYGLMLLLGFSSSASSVVPAVAPQVQISPEKRQLGNSVVQLGSGFGSSIGISIYTMVIASSGVEGGLPTALYIATGGAIILLLTSTFLKKLPVTEPSKQA
jgi:MFS family permease